MKSQIDAYVRDNNSRRPQFEDNLINNETLYTP